MRVYSWRHVIGLWTIVAACVLGGIAPLKAQDWFRQRTYDGQAAPVTIDLAKRAIDEITKAATITRVPVGQSFPATGLPLAIPDNTPAGVSSTVAVPAITPFVSVTASVNITHTFRGDLVVTLTSPTGAVFTLSNQEGGSADNLVLTNQPVAVAAGSAVQGNWVLKVVDRAAGDTGQLVSWSLSVNTSTTALIDLTVSLEADPAGDNNGNTQGPATSAEQDKWERIVQYFADGVYEMTEGAHKIRQVRIFRKGRNFGAADIRWGKKGHPHVPSNGGVGVAGGHVEMFETFEAGGAGGADYDMLADEIGSGYTMAHEWGHFFLGLYDEYNPACGATAVSVSPSIMNSQWNAKAGDRNWLNFSIKRQSGGSFQDTLLNCQHYAYQASAWETLARAVSADPTDQISKGFQTLGPRIAYPELATVAPSGTATPRNDLAATGASARSALDIVWMTDGQTAEIVIDHSTSMSGELLPNAKTAAKLIVDQAVLGKTRIGVTGFGSTVENVFPLTLVTTEAVRTSIKAAIDGIVLSGATAIGDAANSALAKLLAPGVVPAGENKVVFLLSDGESNTGVAPLTVIPAYVAAHVPLFTFGFGAGADSTVLSQMASGTGGRFFFSPTTLPQIVAAFQAANAVATSSPSLGAGSLSPTASAPALVGIPLDASVGTLQLSVSYTGTLLAPTAIQLTTPSGQVVTPTATTTTATATVSGGTVLFYNVATPAAGAWQLTGTAAAAGRTLGYSASAIQTGVGYTVNSGLRDSGPTVTKKGPVILESRLVHRQPVTAATVAAGVTVPSGTTTPLPMADGGVFPDAVAGDGVYTGIYTPTTAGSYSLNVAFTNPNNAARETYQGAAISPTPAGGLGFIPADSLVGENFSRSQTIQFSVESTAVGVVLPTLTTQPSPQFVIAGGNISFVVTATGTPNPTFQWQRKPAGATAFTNLTAGGNFSGVTTGTLVITGATPNLSKDQFRCVVSNSVGSVTSDAATLTVIGTPVRPPNDLDGDGKSDVVVFRPGNGTWYVRYSGRGFSVATTDAFQWGLPGDIPISGDFDGDGKVELSVWRPTTGTWYIRYSSVGYDLGTAQAFQWGLPGDVPIVDDFDGDGKTDLTVFRPANGTWYVRYSSLGYGGTAQAFQWGLPGDVPISADFDGDAKADLVVWRPLNGTWYVRFSSDGYSFTGAGAVQWGLPGDIAVPGADFDGDRKTDLVIWRPVTGTWYVRYSASGYTTTDAFQWGLPGDVPIATDFDADGKAELAVWRPSNGTWYIRYSSLGYATADSYQWGLPGDTVIR